MRMRQPNNCVQAATDAWPFIVAQVPARLTQSVKLPRRCHALDT
jgi:hypothetical protein